MRHAQDMLAEAVLDPEVRKQVLDVLDMPTVNHFETSFAEHFDDKMQNTSRGDGDSLAFYGSGVLPDLVAIFEQINPLDPNQFPPFAAAQIEEALTPLHSAFRFRRGRRRDASGD